MVRAVAKLVLLFALYLLLAGQASTDELVAAALCAGGATGLSLAIPLIAERHFAFHRVPWLRLLASTACALPVEAAQVGGRLARLKPLRGNIQRRPFAAAGTGPEDASRRGLVTLATSLTPNTYVLAVLTGRQELLVHRLVSGKPPRDRKWPL